MDQAVRVSWGLSGARELAGWADALVVIDVLSFTTTVSMAAHRGYRVRPTAWRPSAAEALARSTGARLLSPRGTPGQLTLSPASFLGSTAAEPRDLVLRSLNGSTVSEALASTGLPVFAASLRNASATAGALAAYARPGIIAAGERWPDGSLRPCVEDLLGAGAVVAGRTAAEPCPMAAACRVAFVDAKETLHATLLASPSGRELVDRGFPRDVALAAELDADGGVIVLEDGAYRLRTGEGLVALPPRG